MDHILGKTVWYRSKTHREFCGTVFDVIIAKEWVDSHTYVATTHYLIFNEDNDNYPKDELIAVPARTVFKVK